LESRLIVHPIIFFFFFSSRPGGFSTYYTFHTLVTPNLFVFVLFGLLPVKGDAFLNPKSTKSAFACRLAKHRNPLQFLVNL